MRFLVDKCLSPALAAILRDGGHDAVHVADVGLLGAPDKQVMAVALAAGRTVLSADTDFGELLARSNDVGPSVVLFRGTDVAAASLGAVLLANLGQLGDALEAGAIIVVLDDRLRVRPLPLGVNLAR